MSAQEALAYGLIDEIVQPDDDKLRMLAMPAPASIPELIGAGEGGTGTPEDLASEDMNEYKFGKIVSYTSRSVIIDTFEMILLIETVELNAQ